MKNEIETDAQKITEVLTTVFLKVPNFMRLYTILHSIREKNMRVEALAEFKREIVEVQQAF